MAIELEAIARNGFGRGASRRLRRTEQTPAIIIGQGKEAITIALDEKKLIAAALKPEFFEGLTLVLNGEKIAVKPVDIQRHPVSERMLHLDFLRV